MALQFCFLALHLNGVSVVLLKFCSLTKNHLVVESYFLFAVSGV